MFDEFRNVSMMWEKVAYCACVMDAHAVLCRDGNDLRSFKHKTSREKRGPAPLGPQMHRWAFTWRSCLLYYGLKYCLLELNQMWGSHNIHTLCTKSLRRKQTRTRDEHTKENNAKQNKVFEMMENWDPKHLEWGADRQRVGSVRVW